MAYFIYGGNKPVTSFIYGGKRPREEKAMGETAAGGNCMWGE